MVEYSTKEEAQCAIRELDDTQLLGRSIFVREDREEGSESGAPHFRRGRYGHRAGAGGAQAYGHNVSANSSSSRSIFKKSKFYQGRRGYAYRGSASSDHGYNTRGYGGFNDAYDNFYGRIYNYDRPYSRGDGSSRYGAFDNYRDFGFRRRSGGFNPRDNTYRSNYSRQGFGGRNGMQHGRSYYYGHRNYGGNRGPQPFSGINRNDAPTSVYCRNYGGPYTGGDGLNAGYVGGGSCYFSF